MQLAINDVLHGFRLVERQPLAEISGEGLLFEHTQSGARLLYLANDDDNKTFGIGFRTPSANSTGVAHILEHSVLNGSRKYKAKEPFMELAKTSLATFLNAMTFSDKTIYPVASRNEADFMNLMDVYLDAVFYPSIYDEKRIFLQEGWHYHLEDSKDDITYRGVVYNEMRGALSAADDQVHDAVLEALYPDTIYGYESGGDPYVIPDLSYEDFLNFHRKLYHPINSYLFLYGAVDLDKVLAHINDGYLAHFSPIEVDSHLDLQKPFVAPKRLEATYSVGKEDETEGKDHLVYAAIFGTRTNLRDMFLADLFRDALIDSQAGPLRKALLAKGIGTDVSAFSSDGVQIPFGIVAKDADGKQLDTFVETIESTIRTLLEDGLDKDLLLASLNKIEFAYRESSGYATRGIIHYINAFESWLYDESPFDALAYNAPLAALREDVEAGRLGDELRERFLDNPHKVIMTVRPEPGKNESKDAALRDRLAAYKSALSDEEIQSLVAETHALIERQNSEDSPEAKATLPTLSLSDLDLELAVVAPRTETVAGAEVIFNDIFSAGIVYADLSFKADHIGKESLCDYALLTSLIGNMNTDTYDYGQLVTQEYLKTGGISLSPAIYANFHYPERHLPRLNLSTRMLAGSDPAEFFHLAEEMLLHTHLDDEKRLYEVIQMLRTRMEMGIFQQGHAVATARAKSYLNAGSKYGEALAGLDLLFYLQDLDCHFEERKEDLLARLQDLYRRLINKDELLVNLTGAVQDTEAFRKPLTEFLAKLPADVRSATDFLPDLTPQQEGIASAAGVQYVAKAADLRRYGFTYSGQMEVLSNLLSYEYLYNEIRAKGGAYGQGISFGRSGLMGVYSYRDPNLQETIDVYRGLADWLEHLEADEARILPLIIGTMTRFNPAMTDRAKGLLNLRFRITGQTLADIEKAEAEAKSTTVADLRKMAPVLRQAIDEGVLCVLGNSSKIEAHRELFDKVIRLEGEQ